MDEASRRRVIINTDAKNEADDRQDPQVRPGAPMIAGFVGGLTAAATKGQAMIDLDRYLGDWSLQI